MLYRRPINLYHTESTESVEKCQANQFFANRKFYLGFCSLNEGCTKIKVAKVHKDQGHIKVCFFVQKSNHIPGAMILRHVRSI